MLPALRDSMKKSRKLLRLRLLGTPGEVRTHGLSLRRRPLYPAELRAHVRCYYITAPDKIQSFAVNFLSDRVRCFTFRVAQPLALWYTVIDQELFQEDL